MLFQLTSSRRGWLCTADRISQQIPFQLTSSRRGWLELFGLLKAPRHISTHILTKRMTNSLRISLENMTFQLTSSRRGWQSCNAFIKETILFQLTSSRRGWQLRWLMTLEFRYFNSHPHEEDDGDRMEWGGRRIYFNSHPHEEDDK